MLRRWVEFSPQRQIGESLLGNVGMFVLFVGAEGVESLDANYPDNPAEDVRLFKVNIDEF